MRNRKMYSLYFPKSNETKLVPSRKINKYVDGMWTQQVTRLQIKQRIRIYTGAIVERIF